MPTTIATLAPFQPIPFLYKLPNLIILVVAEDTQARDRLLEVVARFVCPFGHGPDEPGFSHIKELKAHVKASSWLSSDLKRFDIDFSYWDLKCWYIYGTGKKQVEDTQFTNRYDTDNTKLTDTSNFVIRWS